MHRSDMVRELQDLGLTSYEAKSYVSLAGLGQTEPKKVAEDARIPYPSAYTALRSLESKGWADLVVKKPATYRAKRPAEVRTALASKMEDTFGALERLYRAESAAESELVYTSRGSEKVLAKIYEMLRGAEKSIVVAAPTMGLEHPRILELLKEALERRVSVRAVVDEGASWLLPDGTEIRTANLVAVDLLVDGKTALIALPDYSACGWIDSPAVASHFKQFLELLWSTSSPA